MNTLINVAFDRTSNLCQELIRNVLCLYYYPPCDFNGTFTAPVSVCPEECFYVQHECLKLWKYLEISLLEYEFGFINCSSPGQRLDLLPHCCVDAGITMNIATSTPGQTQLQYVHRLQNTLVWCKALYLCQIKFCHMMDTQSKFTSYAFVLQCLQQLQLLLQCLQLLLRQLLLG